SSAAGLVSFPGVCQPRQAPGFLWAGLVGDPGAHVVHRGVFFRFRKTKAALYICGRVDQTAPCESEERLFGCLPRARCRAYGPAPPLRRLASLRAGGAASTVTSSTAS